MAIYILLSRLSQQGVATLKSNPDRLREVNRDVEELGAKVLHQWATLGSFDFVNVVEAPETAGNFFAGVCSRIPRACSSARRSASSEAGPSMYPRGMTPMYCAAVPPNALAVRGLRKRYGSVEALKGVDLEVREGELVGLL